MGFREYLQLDLSTRHGGEAIFENCQVARHQGKQVAGLGERILPGDLPSTVRQRCLMNEVTVGKQIRVTLGIGNNRRFEFGQHVRAVLVVGDFTKTFRLTLSAVHAAGAV